MSVLMIVNAQVNPQNTSALKEYASRSSEIFKSAGAKPLQKIEVDHVLVGDEKPDLIAVTEWPDKQKVLEVFDSEDYKAIIPLRARAFSHLSVYISA